MGCGTEHLLQRPEPREAKEQVSARILSGRANLPLEQVVLRAPLPLRGGQEPRGSASAPQGRPDLEGSHGHLQPPYFSGTVQMCHLCPAGGWRPALLTPFTAAVPTLKSPAVSRDIRNALPKTGRERRD